MGANSTQTWAKKIKGEDTRQPKELKSITERKKKENELRNPHALEGTLTTRRNLLRVATDKERTRDTKRT